MRPNASAERPLSGGLLDLCHLPLWVDCCASLLATAALRPGRRRCAAPVRSAVIEQIQRVRDEGLLWVRAVVRPPSLTDRNQSEAVSRPGLLLCSRRGRWMPAGELTLIGTKQSSDLSTDAGPTVFCEPHAAIALSPCDTHTSGHISPPKTPRSRPSPNSPSGDEGPSGSASDPRSALTSGRDRCTSYRSFGARPAGGCAFLCCSASGRRTG
jgi:hypothetical protein